MSYYPDTVKDWIRRNGGLTTEMKKIKNGGELWKIVDPCPEAFYARDSIPKASPRFGSNALLIAQWHHMHARSVLAAWHLIGHYAFANES
jgi:hypothetical protein